MGSMSSWTGAGTPPGPVLLPCPAVPQAAAVPANAHVNKNLRQLGKVLGMFMGGLRKNIARKTLDLTRRTGTRTSRLTRALGLLTTGRAARFRAILASMV